MGDMADYVNDCIWNGIESIERMEDEGDIQGLYDAGAIDEFGFSLYGSPLPIPATYKRKAFGRGKCPICGAKTKVKNGKFGKFYGCEKWPACKGSRNY